ncbi:hypothetical protein LC55x_5673 [Lysobacter capsici]|jgi:hypothetical protein|uniref:hypothetical protein n=1 Tax=Lysobacter capsici TaxID=435897 RepID=UPI0007167079|nr:hypothetical protein [Lysobacter capsici]ALN88919.1 hypothetical protein LC55x_5673 [Lysobacter capsici]
MRISQHKTLLAAMFVFAAGFASASSAQFNPRCEGCMNTYDYCMSQPDAEQWLCVHQYNVCADRAGCLLMPEI